VSRTSVVFPCGDLRLLWWSAVQITGKDLSWILTLQRDSLKQYAQSYLGTEQLFKCYTLYDISVF
jgi:hypothetical protein